MLFAREGGGERVVAVDAAAAAEGLRPGLTLADARALCPGLASMPADPAGDARMLAGLADWCGRYTPWAAPDGADGIVLDISGCAHLFGGEAGLAGSLIERLAGFGYGVRTTVADTPAAAWAVARFGEDSAIVPPGQAREVLAGLPVAALRLASEMAATLQRLGLRRIGDLYSLPRPALAARFGPALGRRLGCALGEEFEPISPRRPVTALRTRLAWPEPIGHADDIRRAAGRLMENLCVLLAGAGKGARRLELALYHVDGRITRLAIGSSRPSRDASHLLRLLVDRLAGFEAGFGVDVMVLAAPAADPLPAGQGRLETGGGPTPKDADAVLGPLIDRLGNRLGPDSVFRIVARSSHIPERAVAVEPALTASCRARSGDCDWAGLPPRPLRLLPCPEPIEVVAPVPDDPPLRFRWRRLGHRVVRAEGPERIAPEWWREAAPTRDYYRIEDEAGRRFWVYRLGLLPTPTRAGDARPRWYMHGLFP